MDSKQDYLYRRTQNDWDRYWSAQAQHPSYRLYHFAMEVEQVDIPDQMDIAQVQVVTLGVYKKLHSCPPYYPPQAHPTDFLEVLRTRNRNLMWEHADLVGHHTWITTAIETTPSTLLKMDPRCGTWRQRLTSLPSFWSVLMGQAASQENLPLEVPNLTHIAENCWVYWL